jgi:hypothetical protein
VAPVTSADGLNGGSRALAGWDLAYNTLPLRGSVNPYMGQEMGAVITAVDNLAAMRREARHSGKHADSQHQAQRIQA